MRKTFPMGHKTRTVHLATVSGVASTKPELCRWFDEKVPSVEVITTKSFQVVATPGNREPFICEPEVGRMGNSVGLRNPGMEKVLPELRELKEKGLKAWLNVSLAGNKPEDFITLVKAFDEVADSLEVNFSCPHATAGFGAAIGSDKATAVSYIRAIQEAYPKRKALLFVKMTPNVDNVGEIAKAVIEAGADGIAAINTVTPIQHLDPVSGASILQIPGGKGGRSGEQVFPRAVECIKAIREAVGEEVPIIGMGGVTDGRMAAELIEAGADAVGIGSALGHVRQADWETYFSRVKKEAEDTLSAKDTELLSRDVMDQRKVSDYERHTIEKVVFPTPDTAVITLDGNLKGFKAGEFVFLWIPGVGEKPFSVAKADPLTFIIKKRGYFTSTLLTLKEGHALYLRGPYGAEVETPEAKKAIIVAGGTGEAVAYPLSEELEKKGIPMSFLVGTSVEGGKGLMEEELSQKGDYLAVADAGKPGRALDYLPSYIEKATADGTSLEDVAFYLIGPEIFMKIAAKTLLDHGAKSHKVLLSMERSTMCGVGMCGECSCGGKLACQWGTFMTLEFLQKENVL